MKFNSSVGQHGYCVNQFWTYFKSKHLLNLRIFQMKVDEDFSFWNVTPCSLGQTALYNMPEDGIFFIITDMRTQNLTEVNEYSTLVYLNCCKWMPHVPVLMMYIKTYLSFIIFYTVQSCSDVVYDFNKQSGWTGLSTVYPLCRLLIP